MKITRTSLFTGKVHSREIDVTWDQYQEFCRPPGQRRPIQEIVPHLSADDREFLLSGITPEEWAAVFPEGGE